MHLERVSRIQLVQVVVSVPVVVFVFIVADYHEFPGDFNDDIFKMRSATDDVVDVG